MTTLASTRSLLDLTTSELADLRYEAIRAERSMDLDGLTGKQVGLEVIRCEDADRRYVAFKGVRIGWCIHHDRSQVEAGWQTRTVKDVWTSHVSHSQEFTGKRVGEPTRNLKDAAQVVLWGFGKRWGER